MKITVASPNFTVPMYKNSLSKWLERSVLLMAYHDYWVYHINRYIKGTFIQLLVWGGGYARYSFITAVNPCDWCMQWLQCWLNRQGVSATVTEYSCSCITWIL